MKKSFVLLLCIIILTSIFIVGCNLNEEVVATTNTIVTESEEITDITLNDPSGKLVVGISEVSGNFNPLYYSSVYDGYVVDLVFQDLIKRNFEGEYEGNIAESWEYSEDGKSITFNMKKDIVFSDGQPLTAKDVVFTYQVLADPSYTGGFASIVKDLVGYSEYSTGKTEEFTGVEVIDDYTVKFNFIEALRVNFEACSFPIIPKHYYGVNYAVGNTLPIESITTDAMGSGPYVVSQFKEKKLANLKRNPLYTGDGYKIKEIILKFVDQETDIVELTKGDIDLLPNVDESKKISEARKLGLLNNQYNKSGYKYVKTNCEWGPTADVRVRQALYYAFDVKEFVNSYYFDVDTDEVLAVAQYHPFSQFSWAIDEPLLDSMIEYDYNLEKAKELLTDAGWLVGTDGIRYKDGKPLELKIIALPDHDILATLIPMWERDWGKGLGIKLTVNYYELNKILDYVIYSSDANVENWSVFFLASSITTPDPHALYTSFHSSYIGNGLDNTSRYNNPKVDVLLDQGKSIMDIEKAKPVYAHIAKILNEEAVMMPVCANTAFDFYAPKLVDFKTNALYNWVYALKDAKIIEE